MAYDGDGEYLPGEWCTFCKVSVKCRARAEEKMKLARLEFKMPPLLTDAEIEECEQHNSTADCRSCSKTYLGQK